MTVTSVTLMTSVTSSVQSGRAIQHVKDTIFTEEGGVRKGVPKVVVVLTDGRSQDDVNKVSKEMQKQGQRSGFCSGCCSGPG